MNKKQLLSLLMFLLLLIQVNSFAQSINHLKHSEYVLQNLDKYQALGEFLTKNTDTLVLHNLTYSTEISEEMRKERCDSWAPPYSGENLNSIPASLQKSFIEKVKEIEEEHLMIISICMDQSVEFFVANDHQVSEDGYDFFILIHILEYRSDEIRVPFKYPTLRDSLVHPNFNYGIATVED